MNSGARDRKAFPTQLVVTGVLFMLKSGDDSYSAINWEESGNTGNLSTQKKENTTQIKKNIRGQMVSY